MIWKWPRRWPGASPELGAAERTEGFAVAVCDSAASACAVSSSPTDRDYPATVRLLAPHGIREADTDVT